MRFFLAAERKSSLQQPPFLQQSQLASMFHNSTFSKIAIRLKEALKKGHRKEHCELFTNIILSCKCSLPNICFLSSIIFFNLSVLSIFIRLQLTKHALREKCPNTEFFCSVFSCVRTEYRKIRTRTNSIFGHFSRSDDPLSLLGN